jgi:translation initiation factor IF-3
MSTDNSLPSGSGGDLKQQVRLIDGANRSLGIMTLSEATKIADDSRAELVKVTQTASPLIYRLVYPSNHQEHNEKR